MSKDHQMDITLVRKASLHVPQYVNMVNLRAIDNDFDAAQTDPAGYVAGHDARNQELQVDPSTFKRLQKALPPILATSTPAQAHPILEAFAGTDLPENIVELLQQTPAQDEEAVRRLAGSEEVLESVAMDIVETRAALAHKSTEQLSSASRPTAMGLARHAGFKDIAYMESFPLLVAAAGYMRFPHDPNPTFVTFTGGRSPRKQVYVETFETEALIFSLDPQRVLEFVQRHIPEYAPRPEVPVETQLGIAAAIFQASLPSNLGEVPMTVGSLTWSLMHTVSHSVLKAAAEPAGFSVNSFSEYILPGTLSFAVFVNRQQETGIGGLQSVYNDGLEQFLDVLPTSLTDCLHDPTCWDRKTARCHACVLISETSCRAFNAHLDRHLLYGKNGVGGFWG